MNLYYGLTTLGIIHTIISLIAVVTGVVSLTRNGKITWDNTIGKVYVVTTIIVCLTGFGIFQHGGFGKPHALGIITLVVWEVIYLAHQNKLGKFSRYIETIGYSLTFLFHIIPGVTESLTRLPYGAPVAASPEDSTIKMIVGICFMIFLIGATAQVRKMKTETK